jgi:WD repeat-containing protein mio
MHNPPPPPSTAPPRSPGSELFDDNGLPVLTSHRKKRRGSGMLEPVNTFNVMLQTLIGRRNSEPVTWKPTIHTTKLLQRQVALQLCGWSLQEQELMSAIKRWEEEGKLSRAVCWLVFTKKYNKAIELLMKSKGVCPLLDVTELHLIALS